MSLDGFWDALPKMSPAQMFTAVVVIGLILLFFLVKYLLVPGVHRFSAEQQREVNTATILQNRINELKSENEVLKNQDKETRKQKHENANRLQIFVLAYDHSHGLLQRIRELCCDENKPLQGETVPALREICHEAERMKSCQELLRSDFPGA